MIPKKGEPMIKAVFKEEKGKTVSFSVSGHSGFETEGKDIVCAAVSGAVQTVIAVIDGKMGLAGCFSVNFSGVSDVSCDISELSGIERETAETVLGGFKLLMEEWEKDFPKNINVILLP